MLFVDGLPTELTNRELIALFAQYGSVVVSTVARRSATEYLSFGFVTMQTEAEAAQAQSALHGRIVGGYTLRVDTRISPPFGWVRRHAATDTPGLGAAQRERVVVTPWSGSSGESGPRFL